MNKHIISQFFIKLSVFFSMILGRLSWTSPPWMGSLRRQATTRPLFFTFTCLCGLVLLIGLWMGYGWYKNLPQPQYVTGVITPLKISAITEQGIVPDALIIDFGLQTSASENNHFIAQSVAPLQDLNQTVKSGIEISPAIPGTWVWQTESRLVFTPSQDWPAGQAFKIHFDQGVFAKQAKMKSNVLSFSTHAFEAKISEFKFYQDPVEASQRQAIATIQFNFPVDPESFERHVSMMFQALKHGKLDLEAQPHRFNISYDKYKRVAYLHSETLELPEVSRYLVLTIDAGVKSATASDKTSKEITSNLLIPDKNNYFKVLTSQAAIIKNAAQGTPEQILILETSIGVREHELSQFLQVYVLPQNYPATAGEEEQQDYEWKNPGEVTPSILARSTHLDMQPLPSVHPFETMHSFKFKSKTPRYIYLKLAKGAHGFGDIPLTQDYVAVLKVPEYPAEISFLHNGALLALSSEKKLSVLIRGLPAVKFDFARVLPDNLNQLVTQTQGDFNNPMFMNQSFNQQNISTISSEIQKFDALDLEKQQYTALDFAKYMSTANGTDHQGLFLLQATGWDAEKNIPLETKSSRLILITDLGLVVKDNQDGSHDVFVQSITQGSPVNNVDVSILGKNGLPLLTYKTNDQGQVHFPSLISYTDDREPVVYLAKLGSDLSFIPYHQANRQLNYSRYDTGGLYTNNQEQHSLSAYLFSDRGIYRPGDEAHIGIIVKQAYVQPQPPGLTLEATVTDPRGVVIEDKKFTLDALGYLSFDIATNESSPTGQYSINLYIVKDNHPDNFLGSTTIQVAEFQPDRMRIKTHLSATQPEGWVSPEGLMADVQLWNLYGAPATDRRVKGRLVLEPKHVAFKKYPDYVFADPFFDATKPAKILTDTLSDETTNAQGDAAFKLNLERFDKATYQLTFFAEGFEAEGGRSVTTQTTQLVSPLAYLIGYKPNGDLNYMKQDTQQPIHYVAVDPQLKQQAVKGLILQLAEVHPISTLVKKPDGTYQYQSIEQNTVISRTPFDVAAQGTDYVLPTQKVGTFVITILNESQTALSHLKYSVVGTSQVPLEKNTELMVKLDKASYRAGDVIELEITAPYTGAGLITLERDKVYATQWFKTSTTSAVQKIQIPSDFQGNGYVNVTFVRDWSSPDIFSNPLSYGVVPFAVDHEQQSLHIDLAVPSVARPGQPLTIDYHSDKPGKIIVFAVDEGILQAADYTTPDPLGFFFQKRALEVLTQQTVDQILPQFIETRELSAVGGDEVKMRLAAELNPFKRKAEAAIVYWSGIIDTANTPAQLTYQVPDYYNGTMRVMAVGVSSDAVGAAEQQTEVRGDFVINPNVPTFVAPGDEFEITASVANNIKDAGDKPTIQVQLQTTSAVEMLDASTQSLVIAPGHEQTVHFKLKAKQTLGDTNLSLTASLGNKTSTRQSNLSIRPASPFFTTVESGTDKQSKKSVTLDRKLYPEYREVEAVASSSPLILVAGLQRYLDTFPFGCTEQLTSKAFPLLVMGNQPWSTPSRNREGAEKITQTIQLIGQRQMSNGGFSYWPGFGQNSGNDFASVYAMHFLTEARAQGYSISNEMFNAGLRYLSELTSANAANLDMARIQAYAIYVLTRNEIVTTNVLVNLQLYLEKNHPQNWQHDLISVYIASTYQLLKNSTQANQLIEYYKPEASPATSTDFYDVNLANAQYLYLVALHFPERLAFMGDGLVLKLVDAMKTSEIDTLFSAYTGLALNAYAKAHPVEMNHELSITSYPASASGVTEPRPLGSGTVPLADARGSVTPGETRVDAEDIVFKKLILGEEAQQVIFHAPGNLRYFYQLTQAGFDEAVSTQSIQKGLEVAREYRDSEGNVITHVKLGDEIEVHIQIRALEDKYISHLYIVDLLPGGFEVVRDSVKTENMDYADIREDRVVFFGDVGAEVKAFKYKIKATNAGAYTAPAIVAQAMYAPSIQSRGVASHMDVMN